MDLNINSNPSPFLVARCYKTTLHNVTPRCGPEWEVGVGERRNDNYDESGDVAGGRWKRGRNENAGVGDGSEKERATADTTVMNESPF